MNSEPPLKVFGGKASICLKHEGDINALAQKLSKGLMLPAFSIEPSEWPPYEVVGSVEALGWELWLEPAKDSRQFQFSLRMETEHSETESFKGDVHDLSPWLARYISAICGVDSLVPGTQTFFSHGEAKTIGKVESA